MKSNTILRPLLLCILAAPIAGCRSGQYPVDRAAGEDWTRVRRFNIEILAIDSVPVDPFQLDFRLAPGSYELLLQPTMHHDTLVPGGYLEETRVLRIQAERGTDLYLCLGLRWNGVDRMVWEPFSLSVASQVNATTELLAAMQEHGGCVNAGSTLPFSWITE